MKKQIIFIVTFLFATSTFARVDLCSQAYSNLKDGKYEIYFEFENVDDLNPEDASVVMLKKFGAGHTMITFDEGSSIVQRVFLKFGKHKGNCFLSHDQFMFDADDDNSVAGLEGDVDYLMVKTAEAHSKGLLLSVMDMKLLKNGQFEIASKRYKVLFRTLGK